MYCHQSIRVGEGLMSQKILITSILILWTYSMKKNAIIDGTYLLLYILETDIDNCRKPLPDMAIPGQNRFLPGWVHHGGSIQGLTWSLDIISGLNVLDTRWFRASEENR